MAKILILQEVTGPLQALRKSLEANHDLFFVSDSDEALAFLQKGNIDLIITRVHLEKTNVFSFIRTVKQQHQFAHIPLLCFCGKRTEIARSLNASMAAASQVFGADKYLALDHFCSDDDCDFNRLRKEIEDQLA